MSVHSCTPPEPSLPSSLFVENELKRIPISSRITFNRLGLTEDLKQELHLAYYENQGKDVSSVKRALHAAGEKFRYHEIVRRAAREVPESLSPEYQRLVYGRVPKTEEDSE